MVGYFNTRVGKTEGFTGGFQLKVLGSAIAFAVFSSLSLMNGKHNLRVFLNLKAHSQLTIAPDMGLSNLGVALIAIAPTNTDMA